jgi:hypothetical protein
LGLAELLLEVTDFLLVLLVGLQVLFVRLFELVNPLVLLLEVLALLRHQVLQLLELLVGNFGRNARGKRDAEETTGGDCADKGCYDFHGYFEFRVD